MQVYVTAGKYFRFKICLRDVHQHTAILDSCLCLPRGPAQGCSVRDKVPTGVPWPGSSRRQDRATKLVTHTGLGGGSGPAAEACLVLLGKGLFKCGMN